MSNWAAIVYGRTYEVDFRLITIPHNFDERDRQWTLDYIFDTTKYPENLPGNPIWSFFQNHKYRVIGVTCMADELIENSPETVTLSQSIAKDRVGRPLHLFVGYVAQRPFSPVPSKSIKNFARLYKYVEKCWLDKRYDVNSSQFDEKRLSKYEYLFVQEKYASVNENDKPQEIEKKSLFNFEEDKVKVWPTLEDDKLWFIASQYQESLSICFDIPRKSELVTLGFQNGTASDVDNVTTLIKKKSYQTDRKSYEEDKEFVEVQKKREIPVEQISRKQIPLHPSLIPLGFFKGIIELLEEKKILELLEFSAGKLSSKKDRVYQRFPPSTKRSFIHKLRNVSEILEAIAQRIESYDKTIGSSKVSRPGYGYHRSNSIGKTEKYYGFIEEDQEKENE